MKKLNKLQKKVTSFRDARNWKQFHNPKDLAQAISIESAELLEHFLWLTQEESYKKVHEKKEEIAEEMADIFAYLLALAEVADIDLAKSLVNKIEKNELRYPVERSKNNTKKYTKL